MEYYKKLEPFGVTAVLTDTRTYQPYSVLNIHSNFRRAPRNPWEYLYVVSKGVCHHIKYNVANAQELSLEELVTYIGNINPEIVIPQSFKNLAKKHKAEKIVEKWGRNKTKLFENLSNQQYEPLWREIYSKIAESQNGIPTLTELLYDKKELELHREFITRELQKYGFRGTYPYFCKYGSLKRICLAKTYDELHIVGRQKNAKYYIMCNEIPAREYMDMTLYCGAVFCKTTKEYTDIFSCLFDRKGKAFCYPVRTDFSSAPASTDAAWRKIISIAVKKAQLMKLSKEEQNYQNISKSPTDSLILLFISEAILFGASITLCLLGFDLISALFMDGFSLNTVREILCDISWVSVALESGISFALIMTIIEAISRKK